jgi:hypothetical protein
MSGTLTAMVPQQGRWTAELDGDFVVFLIGAAVYDPAVAAAASGLLMAMTTMLDELEADPSKGLLGYTRHGEAGNGVLVQYWRSFDALESYARNPGAATRRCGVSGTASRPTTATEQASGTRPSRSPPATTRRSTRTCRRWACRGRVDRSP